MTATDTLTANLARDDGGEPMPLTSLEFSARLVRTLAALAASQSDRPDAYGETIRGIRMLPWRWDLHDPPAPSPLDPPPLARSTWGAAGEQVEVHYTATVGQIDGLCDWPAGCRDALHRAGLTDADVVVVYGDPEKPEPEAWMPLGRWQETYGRVAVSR